MIQIRHEEEVLDEEHGISSILGDFVGHQYGMGVYRRYQGFAFGIQTVDTPRRPLGIQNLLLKFDVLG